MDKYTLAENFSTHENLNNLPVEQVVPVQPLAHRQKYSPDERIKQKPPFWHGAEEQAFDSLVSIKAKKTLKTFSNNSNSEIKMRLYEWFNSF